MNQSIKQLIENYRSYIHALEPREDVPKIHVDEIAAKVAAFYEKLRGFIDYKEEHLLRKSFIDRVFRRRFFFKDFSGNIGEGIIKEIIRSGRLPNDSVPETKIQEVDAIINNFVEILREVKRTPTKKDDELEEWLTKLTINAIEEVLFPPLKENIMAETMFWSLKDKMTFSGAVLFEGDQNLQLFIAIQRALLRVDDDQLNYRLMKFIKPDWTSLPKEEIAVFVAELPKIKDKIKEHLNHPLRKYFFKLANKYNTIFYLIGDIIDMKMPVEDFAATFEHPEELERATKKVYAARYSRERKRLNRLAFFSVLSIFLSKILVALGIEIPIDYYVTNEFNLTNTLVNIIFPPVLMLLIVLSIKMPSEENEDIVLEVTKNIVYGDEKKGFGIIIPKKKRWLTRFIIQLLYAVLFITVFYYLYMKLKSFGWSDANFAIFAFFTSLVAATGVKIHNRAKEISMEEQKPGVLGFIIDVVSLPFVTVGRWGLVGLSKLNILVVVFNLVIELPFQVFVQFIENFRSFVKSKKEELE